MKPLARRAMLALAALGACADSVSPPVPDSPITLDGTDVVSGWEAVLRSADFSEIELDPVRDSTGALVPNRWTNFRVEVAGAEVDSWRAGADAIAFAVPVADAGTAIVDVSGDGVLPASFTVPRRGRLGVLRYDSCYSVTGPERLPNVYHPAVELGFRRSPDGARVVMHGECAVVNDTMTSFAYYQATHHVDHSLRVYAATLERHPVSEDPSTLLRLSGPGSTYVPGLAVLERRVDAIDGETPAPDVWRVSLGDSVEYVEPVSCSVFPDIPFTVAELTDGLCLTIDALGVIRRNGEQIFDLYDEGSVVPAAHFVTSVNGWSLATWVMRAGSDLGPEFPVFGADGRLAYAIPGFSGRTDLHAAWSPSGAAFLLAYYDEEERVSALERRDATTGEVLARRTLEGEGRVGAPTFVGDAIWVASRGVSTNALLVLDAATLVPERVVRFENPPWVAPHSLVFPDSTGSRAYIVTYWDIGLHGVAVEVF